ncbi:MAG: hypothetical protein CMJ49_13570 [Planctomycetaceae bacterium]|nr:hypothetical protein [Planctomycetaceae bacterium]
MYRTNKAIVMKEKTAGSSGRGPRGWWRGLRRFLGGWLNLYEGCPSCRLPWARPPKPGNDQKPEGSSQGK